jgi:sugar lactone lactonase YvrE
MIVVLTGGWEAMRRISALAALLVALACAPAEQEPAAADTTSLEIANAGLATPESAVHDPAGDVYLVSNINGAPSDKDDNGFVSRIGPDGAVLALKWIDGAGEAVTLHAPKGLAITGDTLFVTDIDVVRLFDRSTGAPLGELAVAGATFLNDIAVGPDGTIYVTDTGIRISAEGMQETGTDAVYRLTPTGATPILQGGELGRPNGVTADTAGIVVVTFGSGAIFRVDPATGARSDLPAPPQGQLDGVVGLADGSLLVSSWAGSRVYRLAGGQWTALGDSVPSPADLGFDTRRNRVLIPVFQENRVLIRPVHGGR